MHSRIVCIATIDLIYGAVYTPHTSISTSLKMNIKSIVNDSFAIRLEFAITLPALSLFRIAFNSNFPRRKFCAHKHTHTDRYWVIITWKSKRLRQSSKRATTLKSEHREPLRYYWVILLLLCFHLIHSITQFICNREYLANCWFHRRSIRYHMMQ